MLRKAREQLLLVRSKKRCKPAVHRQLPPGLSLAEQLAEQRHIQPISRSQVTHEMS